MISKGQSRGPPIEMLERLGRGIKPSMTKKEMYEINKRGVGRLPENQKSTVESDKKKALLERREKVKMLDQVFSFKKKRFREFDSRLHGLAKRFNYSE